MKAITATNVINAKEYKDQVREVFKFTGGILAHTLGPCANTSIIEQYGPLIATKDGFHTLKHLNVAPQDTFANNILTVIRTMSQRMVGLVGDGSTSAVVAAWKFIETLLDSDYSTTRPRDLNHVINDALKQIMDYIVANATFPKDTDLLDVVYKTALVSTNGDEEFAKIIRDVYEKAGQDATFNLIKQPNQLTTEYDIVDGYKANQYRLIDPQLYNTKKAFEAHNVKVVCFDMALTRNHWEMVERIRQLASEGCTPANVPEIVVVASSFDQDFLELVKRQVQRDYQLMQAKSLRHLTVRYIRALCVDQWQRSNFMDFAQLSGSDPITTVDFNKMVNILDNETNFDDEILKRAIGEVGYMKATTGDTTISDFKAMDKAKFEVTLNRVKEVYEELSAQNVENSIPSLEYIKTRIRYNKLKCKMVDLKIGAANEIERELVYDAADDATKACESVVKYGYNVGGNMAILFAINNHPVSSDPLVEGIYDVLYKSFVKVVEEVFANKYTSDGFESLDKDVQITIDDIIEQCVKNHTYYDLISEHYTNDIINSSRTDTEILEGAISIALTLVTSNQYISQIPNISVE